jgi:predicted alpha/beta superfamily hydrolase
MIHKENVMRTRKVLSGILLLLIVLSTGYSSVTAEGLASRKVTMEGPVAGQFTERVIPSVLITAEAVTIPDTEVSIFTSDITGQDYRIYVSLPQGYSAMADKPPKYPVIYSLDANWHFAVDTGSSRSLKLGGELGDVIVVGIGYPTDDDNEIMSLRAWDMRPGQGAEAFLGFIQEELIPHIDANFRTVKQDRTLAGHSYGGLFTLYALFHATDTFQRYVAMSPALWYGYEYEDQRVVFDYEEAYASEHHKLPVDLFLSVGEFEPEEMYGGLWMVSNLIEFHQVLEDRDYGGLKMEMVIVEGLGHAGSYPGAFTRGLVEVFP